MRSSFTYSFFGTTYEFKLKKIFLLVCAALFALCISLSIWQFHRYTTKKQLLNFVNANVEPKKYSELKAGEVKPFTHLIFEGRYLIEDTFFIQNQVRNSISGYEVITPFQVKDTNKILLIDRGWLNNLTHPDLYLGGNIERAVKGKSKYLNEYHFILGKNILEPLKKPLVLQKIDLKELQQLTHENYLPFILQLDPSEPNGFERNWVNITVPPERHVGYAIQWLAFAIIILIGFICFCSEKVEAANDK